jgi:hypothetical protein
MGACSDARGCFASASPSAPSYGDIPGVCTEVAVEGKPAGQILTGIPGYATLGGVGCVGSSSSTSTLLARLVDGLYRLPGPLVTSTKVKLQLDD